jgi:hypothetical protein
MTALLFEYFYFYCALRALVKFGQVRSSVTMGANLTLAMGKKKLAAAVVKLSGLCFISEIIERHLLVCCSCVARPEYEGRS